MTMEGMAPEDILRMEQEGKMSEEMDKEVQKKKDFQKCYECGFTIEGRDELGQCPSCGQQHWGIYLDVVKTATGNYILPDIPDLEADKGVNNG